MPGGIIIFGGPGSGKTTLGGEVARRLAIRHIDLDDYYWRWDTEIPFTVFRPKADIVEDLMKEVHRHPDFVMSGSMDSIRHLFNPLFQLAAFVQLPNAIRMERLRAREAQMFGERILQDGDMHERNIAFLEEAALYETGEPPMVCQKQHAIWAAELTCPVLDVDGTRSLAENAAWIAREYVSLKG